MLSWASAITWGIFGADFGIRVWLAEQRGRYATRHWYEVLLIALPMLRPLRLLRLVTLAKVMNHSVAVKLTGRVGIYIGGSALAVVGLRALAELSAERGAK